MYCIYCHTSVGPYIVLRNRKRFLLSQSTLREEFVEKKYQVFEGAPICNIVLQHFDCNMVDAIRTTRQETLFGSLLLLLLWFLALVLAGCCHLVCFEFGVLRCPCIPETGRLENKYRGKKIDLPSSRARGSTWPFSRRKLSSCTYRGFPAALLSRRRRMPRDTNTRAHTCIRIQRTNTHPLCASPKS